MGQSDTGRQNSETHGIRRVFSFCRTNQQRPKPSLQTKFTAFCNMPPLCPRTVDFSISLFDFRGFFARLSVTTRPAEVPPACCSFAALPKTTFAFPNWKETRASKKNHLQICNLIHLTEVLHQSGPVIDDGKPVGCDKQRAGTPHHWCAGAGACHTLQNYKLASRDVSPPVPCFCTGKLTHAARQLSWPHLNFASINRLIDAAGSELFGS